mgnify:CR=1 FL=1
MEYLNKYKNISNYDKEISKNVKVKPYPSALFSNFLLLIFSLGALVFLKFVIPIMHAFSTINDSVYIVLGGEGC